MWEFESVEPKQEPYHLKDRGYVHYVIAPPLMQYKDIEKDKAYGGCLLKDKKVMIDGKVYIAVGVETFCVGRLPDDYLSKSCNWRVGLCVK